MHIHIYNIYTYTQTHMNVAITKKRGYQLESERVGEKTRGRKESDVILLQLKFFFLKSFYEATKRTEKTGGSKGRRENVALLLQLKEFLFKSLFTKQPLRGGRRGGS